MEQNGMRNVQEIHVLLVVPCLYVLFPCKIWGCIVHMPWFRNGTSKYLFVDHDLRMGLSHKLHMKMYIPILSMGTHSSGTINEGGWLNRGGSTTPAHASIDPGCKNNRTRGTGTN